MPHASNLEPKFDGVAQQHPIIHLDTIDSTNSHARTLLTTTTPPPHLTTIIADHQSAGRGRLGRSWITTRHGALTATTLLRLPSPLPNEAPAWCLHATALAIRDALTPILRPHAHTVTTKWPNDVLIDGERKICGILAEDLGQTHGSHYLAIGYGVNIIMDANARPAPHATALSLEGDEEAQHSPLTRRATLLDAILNGIDARFRTLQAAQWDPTSSGLADEAQRHCVTLGQQVALPHAHSSAPEAQTSPMKYGRALAIDRSGALVVERKDGTHSLITTGDVLLPHEYPPRPSSDS